ncbi:DUF6660 family protein [Ferruginibacter profundus]
MKILAFIMALMVLVLSCVPCMDGAFAMKNGNIKAEISKSTGNHNEHNDSDNCSPFCTCNCCTGFTFSINTFQAGTTVFYAAKTIAFHLPSEISNIALPIWQPPQLV